VLDRKNHSKPLISLDNLDVKVKTELPDFPAKVTEISNIAINTIKLETQHVETTQKYSLKPLIVKIENPRCKTDRVTAKRTEYESPKNLAIEIKEERPLGNSNFPILSCCNSLIKKNKKDWKLFLKFGLKDSTVELEKYPFSNSNFQESHSGIHPIKNNEINSTLLKTFG